MAPLASSVALTLTVAYLAVAVVPCPPPRAALPSGDASGHAETGESHSAAAGHAHVPASGHAHAEAANHGHGQAMAAGRETPAGHSPVVTARCPCGCGDRDGVPGFAGRLGHALVGSLSAPPNSLARVPLPAPDLFGPKSPVLGIDPVPI